MLLISVKTDHRCYGAPPCGLCRCQDHGRIVQATPSVCMHVLFFPLPVISSNLFRNSQELLQ